MKVYLKEECVNRYPDYVLRLDVSYDVLNAFIDDDTTLYEVIDDNEESAWLDSKVFMTPEEYNRKLGEV